MKAKEYYAKYHDQLISPDDQTSLEAISDLIYDFSMELKTMCEQRRAKTDDAARSIVRELNEKYNAIVALFEVKDGGSPICRDRFFTYWSKRIPGLKDADKKRTAARLSSMAQMRVAAGMGFSEGLPKRNSHVRMRIDFSNPNALTTLAMFGMMAENR